MSPRNFQSVFYKIRYLVFTQCEDTILHQKWVDEINRLYDFEKTKATEYFNLTPEALESLKWRNLECVLDACISDATHFVYDWEKRAIDIFLGYDAGTDLPDDNDPDERFREPTPCICTEEDDYSDEEERAASRHTDTDEEEERQLASQEKAASRHAERKHRDY
jgi:hypothetical protein